VTAAVLTPFVRNTARSAGPGKWRKRLLPVGDVSYKGRILKFTTDYLKGLAQAFSEQAYDQVPLQLAGDENKHTNDVERFGGDISGMEVDMAGPDGPGLYVTVNATERGNKVLMENPRCGVSARIVEDYDRSDGKFFPRAIQHVLATLDPRIPGLGGWQAVEASNMPDVIIDLSGYQFAGEEGSQMPELTEEQKTARLSKLLEIPPEQIDKILAGISNPEPIPPAGAPPAGDGTEGEDDELVAMIEAMSDQELAELEAEFERETTATASATGLTAEAQMAIEMANSRADENERQLGVIQKKMDDDSFEAEKRKLAHDQGIPPYITELAKPLLHGTGHVVDLSNGNTVDAGQVMRRVLGEVGRMGRMLDFGAELGSSMDEPESAATQAADEARQELIDRAKAAMRIR
jgi:hypothetical protein